MQPVMRLSRLLNEISGGVFVKVELTELSAAAKKISKLSDELTASESTDFDSILSVSSSLVSVSSFIDQLRAALTGDYGLVTLLDWHKAESSVVSASLKDLAGVVGAQDADLSEALDGFYRTRGAEQHHSPFYVPEVTSLGNGFETKDGRRFHTLTGHGIPLAEEPLGRDAETLATEFARAPMDIFSDIRRFAHNQAEIVSSVSYEIHKVAEEVKNSGSSDAFTYEAGLGIHRWADSMSELSTGFTEVNKRTRVFATAVSEAQAEFEEICSERKSAHSQDQAAFQEAKFIEKANKVIAGSYNPGIHGADTKAVEFAMPMRAVRPEEIPFPGEPGFPGGSGSGFDGSSGIGGSGVGGGALPQTPDFRGATAPEVTPKPQAPTQPGPGTIDMPDKPDPSLPTPSPHPDPSPTAPAGPNTPTAPGQGVGGYTPPAGTKAATFTPTPNAPGAPTTPGVGAGTIPTPGRGGFTGQTPGPLRAPNGTPIPSPGPAPFWQGGFGNTGSGGGAGGSGGPRLAPGSPKTPGGAGAARPGTPGAAGAAGARGGAAGMRGMGMMGAPGAGGAGGKRGGKGFKRSKRSAKNTRKILRLDEQEQALYGAIRHPSDPLFGTGR